MSRRAITAAAVAVALASGPAWAASAPVDQSCTTANRTLGVAGDTVTQTFTPMTKEITGVDLDIGFMHTQPVTLSVRLVSVVEAPANGTGVAGLDVRVLGSKDLTVRGKALRTQWVHVPLSPAIPVPAEVSAGAATLGLQLLNVPGQTSGGRATSYAWMLCKAPYDKGRGLATGNVLLSTTQRTPLEVDTSYDYAFRTYGH